MSRRKGTNLCSKPKDVVISKNVVRGYRGCEEEFCGPFCNSACDEACWPECNFWCQGDENQKQIEKIYGSDPEVYTGFINQYGFYYFP